MELARYFPGLPGDQPMVEYLDGLTPEQTRALLRAGEPILEREAKDRVAHTEAVMKAAGMRVF